MGAGQVATFGLRRFQDYLVFWAGHEMGDVVWYAFVAALLALGRNLLSDGVYQGLLLGCGVVICLLAVLFLVLGMRCLRPGAQVRRAGGTSNIERPTSNAE